MFIEWLERMNAALGYIEANLAAEIDQREAARRALCSPDQFQKLFSLMSGCALGEYIRNRRLCLAAEELRKNGAKVIDTALKYGYESPTAFNRAFKNLHGVSPKMAKRDGVAIKAYPPITFQMTIKGAVMMQYKTVQVPAFRVVGKKLTVTTKDGENFKKIPEFWCACEHDCPALLAIAKTDPALPAGLLGVCRAVEFHSDHNVLDYYVAVVSDQPVPAGMEALEIPAATYAAFTSVGPIPKALQDLTQRVFSDWFPNAGYEFGAAPDIEVYTDGDMNADDYVSELWVSIRK